MAIYSNDTDPNVNDWDKSEDAQISKQELLNKRLNLIIGPLYVKVTMYLMVVSFFYNLPVIKYSVFIIPV